MGKSSSGVASRLCGGDSFWGISASISGRRTLRLNAPLCSANKDMLAALVRFKGCGIRANTIAKCVTDSGIILHDQETGEDSELKADAVVLAAGFRSDTALYQAMRDVPELYAVGDCRECRNIHQAIWDAYEVANHI